ncbi:MAG TPA: type II toxin-antitoxin system death-on-curing family toxin [Ktedonobacteraceae bacterium]|jgi:death-on-curing protein|nr:type II toxin-antitoxin system death-on-curing family toxin [Ktedonobacteraceae bacterium]
MIRFLPKELVLAIHDDQIRLYGGSYQLRDEGMLDAALAMPQAQFERQFLHETIFQMAAAYGFHICQNHPFIDGNKRAAGMTMFTFLQLNGLKPVASEIDYYHTMMAIANGKMGKEQLARWLETIVQGTPPEI